MNDKFRNRLRKYDRIGDMWIGSGKLQENEYPIVTEIDKMTGGQDYLLLIIQEIYFLKVL